MTTATAEDIRTTRPSVQTQQDPQDPKYAHALPIQVTYRLFAKSPVRTKTFGVTDEGREGLRAFIESMRAKAEIRTDANGNKSWVLVDKGSVDYMVVSFVDPEILSIIETRKAMSKQLVANWRNAK
jgi:hypothetical protein